MVRRWSYINYPSSSLSNLNFRRSGSISAYYNFKAFKKTTFFKKYNLSSTVFFRKKNIRRRRPFDFLNFSHIAYTWVKYYLSLRRQVRCSQLTDIFKFSRSISSWDLFSKNSTLLGYSTGAIIASGAKQKWPVLLSPDKNIKPNPLFFHSVNSFLSEKHSFTTTNLNCVLVTTPLTTTSLKITLNLLTSARSIIVMCSLLNLFYAIRKRNTQKTLCNLRSV
jgi:hypothetical protein